MPDETSGFNWVDVAKVVAPMAPTLGGLLGGLIPFPGGALAGQALGSIIASKFGVEPTPQAVKGAVEGNNNEVVLAKLTAATAEMQARYAGNADIERAHAEVERAHLALIGKSVDQVNQTMRAQVGHEHWFFSGWRAAAGWVFDIYAFLFGLLLVIATAQALDGNKDPLNVMQQAWPLYVGYFGSLGAMVGVYIVGRSQEKVASVKTGASS